MLFPEYVSLRKALRAVQQDARRSSRSFAEAALATPTMQTATVQEAWMGSDTRHAIGCGFE
jgi:uncharacterized membrane protein